MQSPWLLILLAQVSSTNAFPLLPGIAHTNIVCFTWTSSSSDWEEAHTNLFRANMTTEEVQWGKGQALPADPIRGLGRQKDSCLHRWPKPGLCTANFPVTTMVSSNLGYTPVAYSVTSNDAWNKSAIWIGHVVAVLGTSSEAVSSDNSYWDSDFSVLTFKTPTSCNNVLQFSPKLFF